MSSADSKFSLPAGSWTRKSNMLELENSFNVRLASYPVVKKWYRSTQSWEEPKEPGDNATDAEWRRYDSVHTRWINYQRDSGMLCAELMQALSLDLQQEVMVNGQSDLAIEGNLVALMERLEH